MPTRPQHPCTGCGRLVSDRPGPCIDCARARARERERHRPTPTQRGYNAEYRKARAQVLTPGALCHWCGTVSATVCDHLVPLSRGGTNDIDNLVPSCVACNARRVTRQG